MENNGIRYVRCIKEVKEKETDNPFLAELFKNQRARYMWDSYSTSYYYYNYPPNFQEYEKRYDFDVNKIYKYDGEFITDGSLTVHKYEDIQECFEPFEFEIEPSVKKVIEIKKSKGDNIIIVPQYCDNNGNTIYSIFVSILNGERCCNTYSTTQFEGIKYCYWKLFEMDNGYRKIKEAVISKVKVC